MKTAGMIRAFYGGASIATIAEHTTMSVAEVEMLLRGYILGLREARPVDDEEAES